MGVLTHCQPTSSPGCGWPLCSNSRYIAHVPQQCHNLKCVIFQERLLKVLKCYNFLWVRWRWQLISSGELCKLRYEAIPVKSASANVSFYTNNSKMPNFELWHSCRKRAIAIRHQDFLKFMLCQCCCSSSLGPTANATDVLQP